MHGSVVELERGQLSSVLGQALGREFVVVEAQQLANLLPTVGFRVEVVFGGLQEPREVVPELLKLQNLAPVFVSENLGQNFGPEPGFGNAGVELRSRGLVDLGLEKKILNNLSFLTVWAVEASAGRSKGRMTQASFPRTQ